MCVCPQGRIWALEELDMLGKKSAGKNQCLPSLFAVFLALKWAFIGETGRRAKARSKRIRKETTGIKDV